MKFSQIAAIHHLMEDGEEANLGWKRQVLIRTRRDVDRGVGHLSAGPAWRGVRGMPRIPKLARESFGRISECESDLL